MKKIILIFTIVSIIISTLVFSPFVNAEKEMRGVWLSSVKNLDFPSDTGLSVKQLKSELDAVVTNCIANDLNTIFFQVRPYADALYKSSIFPWSEVLSGTQGKAPADGFDPLAYLLEKAHSKNIDVHAWINPYRIGMGGVEQVISSLSPDNPAIEHPEYRVECSDGGVYFNPALPEVRTLIINGVLEIIQNYDVDGIHFDDYFYPYEVEDYPDSEDFQKYGVQFDTIEDFRRNNVNLLIEAVSKAIKSIKPNVSFGISPFGIWDNKEDNPEGSDTSGMSSYSAIFADSRYWVQQGLLDYICPQVYWSFENTAAPFKIVCDWWDELCSRYDTDLYIGLALYKLGTEEKGFDDSSQIQRQLKYINGLSNVDGCVFFRYGCLDLLTLHERENKKLITTEAFTTNSLLITSSKSYSTEDATVNITGVANINQPLTVNGKNIEYTEHGYFSSYHQLDIGINTFKVKNGDMTETVSVTRKPVSSNVEMHNTCFVKGSSYPNGDCKLYSGESVEFSVKALSKAKVFLEINGEPTELTSSSSENGISTFSATLNLPNINTGNFNFDSICFYATLDEQRYEGEPLSIKVISSTETLFTLNESYVFNGPGTGSQMDNYQLPASCAVNATGYVDGYYRLESGKWISEENVALSSTDADSLKIDPTKYEKFTLKFDRTPEFISRVSDSGVLTLNLYGSFTLDECPKIVRQISNGVGMTLVFDTDYEVTGFYVAPENDETLSVYLYKKQSDGIKGKTIVIDVGHGGEDSGALGPVGSHGASESELNLALSYMLKQKLESLGAVVYMTRKDNSSLPLVKRAELIRSYSPDLSISIHHNSTSTSSDYNKASGTLILHSRETAVEFCNELEKNIESGLSVKCEGIKAQSLAVCREYRFPALLVECGYVCNPSEYEILLTESYKKDLCDNIVKSVSNYFL